jgi:hypothetical protein
MTRARPSKIIFDVNKPHTIPAKLKALGLMLNELGDLIDPQKITYTGGECRIIALRLSDLGIKLEHRLKKLKMEYTK